MDKNIIHHKKRKISYRAQEHDMFAICKLLEGCIFLKTYQKESDEYNLNYFTIDISHYTI